jgi:arabinofuranosyltransferase
VEAGPPGSCVVLESITIGLGSVAAGPDVHVIDVLGLANPVGSRIPADPAARIGHQKRLPPAHVFARLTLDREDGSLPADVDPATLEAARQLLRQPPVVRLLAATRDPLTPARALRNIREALALTRLRLSIDPMSGTTPTCDASHGPVEPTQTAITGSQIPRRLMSLIRRLLPRNRGRRRS